LQKKLQTVISLEVRIFNFKNTSIS